MKKILQSISTKQLIFVGCLMAILPIFPEPHLVEKAKMLWNGSLTRALDIFDIFWHTLPFWILFIKQRVEKNNVKEIG